MQILSSLSGLQFSAASAGYAPTNSGDVSAIASAYQVVSATATQLYAGMAYLTSVNGAPVSASRAGNAANALLAASAWYDGTGRFISALPDSATVSSIASSYAESAVSSKLDASAASGFYTTANESGFVDSSYVDSAVSSKQDKLTFGYDGSNNISSIDGSALAGGGGGGGIDSATCSAIASSYAESAVSSYVPYSSLEYNTANAISGINGSALAAGSTYSAGEGIDITDDVISVEAPVDIVAGPGIVIDNPDGNTLRVSVAQDMETVLYDAGDSPSQAGPWQISEARTNFEWVDIVFGNDITGSMKQVTRFAADSDYMKLHLPRYDEEPSYKWSTMTLSWNNTTASIKTNSVGRFTIASNGSVSVSTAAAQAPYLFQIIGVHRINGGN